MRQREMIALDRLTKRFDDVVAVDALSLSVSSGKVFGLLGPNGAGKTTTVRIILGLLKPSGGEVSIEAVRVSDDPLWIKRRIGLVSASAGLYPWLTPREVLTCLGHGVRHGAGRHSAASWRAGPSDAQEDAPEYVFAFPLLLLSLAPGLVPLLPGWSLHHGTAMVPLLRALDAPPTCVAPAYSGYRRTLRRGQSPPRG